MSQSSYNYISTLSISTMRNFISILSLFIIAFFQTSCDQEMLEPQPHCDVLATVRDLSGLDGCGFVFEIAREEGSDAAPIYLEPVRLRFCGTPPLSEEITSDPLYNFEFLDGKQVWIAYEILEDYGSYCMVGSVVKIACLVEVDYSFQCG
jgi:hypothetical protein